MPPGLCCVVPSGDEEDVRAGTARPDHLLLDAADRDHIAVQLDRSGGRDLEPAIDVAAQLLDDVERECEPRRRAADAAEVDLDVDRQPDVRGLLDLDSDDRPARLVGARDRADLDRLRGVAAPDARSLTLSPGLCVPISRRRSSGVFTALPVLSTATITSVGSSFPGRRSVFGNPDDERPSDSALTS